MRAIWSYISREFCSNSATASGSRDFLALATYSSVSPSTISTLARPRIDRDRAWSGVSPTSMVKATSGRADSAATLGELGAVETTTCSPVQEQPDRDHPWAAVFPDVGQV